MLERIADEDVFLAVDVADFEELEALFLADVDKVLDIEVFSVDMEVVELFLMQLVLAFVNEVLELEV